MSSKCILNVINMHPFPCACGPLSCAKGDACFLRGGAYSVRRPMLNGTRALDSSQFCAGADFKAYEMEYDQYCIDYRRVKGCHSGGVRQGDGCQCSAEAACPKGEYCTAALRCVGYCEAGAAVQAECQCGAEQCGRGQRCTAPGDGEGAYCVDVKTPQNDVGYCGDLVCYGAATCAGGQCVCNEGGIGPCAQGQDACGYGQRYAGGRCVDPTAELPGYSRAVLAGLCGGSAAVSTPGQACIGGEMLPLCADARKAPSDCACLDARDGAFRLLAGQTCVHGRDFYCQAGHRRAGGSCERVRAVNFFAFAWQLLALVVAVYVAIVVVVFRDRRVHLGKSYCCKPRKYTQKSGAARAAE